MSQHSRISPCLCRPGTSNADEREFSGMAIPYPSAPAQNKFVDSLLFV